MQNREYCSSIFKSVPCIVSIGVFDGFHLGHKLIIEKNVELSRKLGVSSVVVSFSRNPKMAKGTLVQMKPLTSFETFEEMLVKSGVDYHCVIDFSDDMSKLTGEEFIAGLCTSYDVRAMVVGSSFRCGNKANSVGVSQIEKLLSEYTSSAFLEVVPSVLLDGEEVSSSLIRRCLLTGDLEETSRLLGRAYSLDLRGLNPTSSHNRLLYEIHTLGQMLPCNGKYMVEATASGKTLIGEACISESSLALELPVWIKPDWITFLGE